MTPNIISRNRPFSALHHVKGLMDLPRTDLTKVVAHVRGLIICITDLLNLLLIVSSQKKHSDI
jgi:hypothetical protein